MDGASLAAPIIATWGVYGVILVVLFLMLVYVAKLLFNSYAERMTDLRDMLKDTLKNSAETAQALRDLKTTVDAVVSMFRTQGAK